MVLAVQTNTLNTLQQKNGELRAVKDKQQKTVSDNAAQAVAEPAAGELERLRKDNDELVKLQSEIAQLNTQLQGMPQLQTENQRLKAQAQVMSSRDVDEQALDEARKRAERIQCVNNLKQVGLAARIWASDNNDVYPSNFICMTNEMSTWKILQCPSDKGHKVSNWVDVAEGNISYVMDVFGLKEGGPDYSPNLVFVECPIHHNVCLMDGSVHQLRENDCEVLKMPDGTEKISARVKMVNGRKELVFTPWKIVLKLTAAIVLLLVMIGGVVTLRQSAIKDARAEQQELSKAGADAGAAAESKDGGAADGGRATRCGDYARRTRTCRSCGTKCGNCAGRRRRWPNCAPTMSG